MYIFLEKNSHCFSTGDSESSDGELKSKRRISIESLKEAQDIVAAEEAEVFRISEVTVVTCTTTTAIATTPPETAITTATAAATTTTATTPTKIHP
jgi:hypothetical protein